MAKRQLSNNQKNILIEFIEDHPQLVTQKHSNQYSNVDSRKLWLELTAKLNSIPGATKEWRKTWADIKTRTKKKKADNKKEANQTGGGPNLADPVDNLDDKILDIIGGDILIEGLPVPELGFVEFVQNTEKVQLDTDHKYAKTEQQKDGEDPNKENILKNNKNKSNLKRVRPPLRTVTRSRQTSVQASVKTGNDLVEAQLQLNKIKENYYTQKLAILDRIATSFEKMAEKNVPMDLANLQSAYQLV